MRTINLSADESLSPALADALESLYADLDRDLAALGASCRACGHCCHFDEVEHILYATDVEIRFLLDRAPPPVSVPPGRCPWQDGTACCARDGRTLGCRTHFCSLDPDRAARLEDLAARVHTRLKELHEIHDVPYAYHPLLATLPMFSGFRVTAPEDHP